jgi:hypothetical protein
MLNIRSMILSEGENILLREPLVDPLGDSALASNMLNDERKSYANAIRGANAG